MIQRNRPRLVAKPCHFHTDRIAPTHTELPYPAANTYPLCTLGGLCCNAHKTLTAPFQNCFRTGVPPFLGGKLLENSAGFFSLQNWIPNFHGQTNYLQTLCRMCFAEVVAKTKGPRLQKKKNTESFSVFFLPNTTHSFSSFLLSASRRGKGTSTKKKKHSTYHKQKKKKEARTTVI